MHTPKQHRRLVEAIIASHQETVPRRLVKVGTSLQRSIDQQNWDKENTLPKWDEVTKNFVAGVGTELGYLFRLSKEGRLEINIPVIKRVAIAYHRRLLSVRGVKVLTAAASIGIPVGYQSKEWLSHCLRDSGLAKEAETTLKNASLKV